MDLWRPASRQALVLYQVSKKKSKNVFVTPTLFRTDSQDRHINGQGNFGFCSSSCVSVNNDVDYQLDTDFGVNSRSKFVNVEERDPTAIMFTDNQDDDDAVKMPPS